MRYNVYRCDEGNAEIFLGTASSIDEARRMVNLAGFEKSLWDTARAAGHVSGYKAPDTRDEDNDRAEWISETVVAVPIVAD